MMPESRITILYWFAIVSLGKKYSDSSFFALCYIARLLVLVCFQHLLFQFTIYDFDSFWFMCFSPVKYLSSTLFLNEHTRKKGDWLNAVFFSLTSRIVDQQLFVSFTLCCYHFHALVFVYLAISCDACSVLFTIPVSLRLLYKKQWNIFTHETRREEKKKESWLTKMKSKEKKAGNNNV